MILINIFLLVTLQPVIQKRFLEIIRELPEGNVDVQVSNERVTVNFTHGQFSLMGMSSSDFPALRDSVEGMTMVLSSSDFVEMVEKTSFSVASERTRISLTGVYWNVLSDKMFMVATDGHVWVITEKFQLWELWYRGDGKW